MLESSTTQRIVDRAVDILRGGSVEKRSEKWWAYHNLLQKSRARLEPNKESDNLQRSRDRKDKF